MTDHYTALGLNSAATLTDVKKSIPKRQASFLAPTKHRVDV
jgi:hypothetical protein